MAAKVREAVKEMPVQLEHKFGIIEVFLAIFPGDTHIRNASVELVVSIFLAIEKAIEFFVKHQLARGVAVLIQGEKYEEELLDRISQIQRAGDHLIEVAKISEVSGTRQAMMALLEGNAKIIRSQDEAGAKLEIMDNKLDVIDRSQSMISKLLNTVHSILEEGAKEREKKDREEKRLQELLERERRERREEKERERVERERERAEWKRERAKEQAERENDRQAFTEQISDIKHLVVVQQNEVFRKLTPSPSPRPVSTPGPQDAAQYPALPQQQHGLPAAAHPGLLPWNPMPYMELMVQSQPYYPPQPPLWYPQPVRPTALTQSTPAFTVEALLKLLQFPSIDKNDLEEVLSNREIISANYVARAEQVAGTPQFRDWAIMAKSTELLVEGNFGLGESHYVSALSVLCATFMKAVRTREKYISLVFFCGCHPEDDQTGDDDGNSTAGGVYMIKSLITQLIEQHHDFDLTELDRQINQQLVEDGDLDELCTLFDWLVRRLPERLTFMCIIDGVMHYEIDAWEDELIKVMSCLLDLTRDEDVSVPVKVLVTSPNPTESIRELFDTEDDSSYLTLDSFNEANYVPGMLEFEELDEESATYSSDDDAGTRYYEPDVGTL
ncbi:hypothetical protein Dda_2299 [Drechslerella dactyloides]|uniref:Nephrocystin 3-like N-terminal domain-containing protein n=1 Tax=Drechslerella dactyloides TaxID=74499 RepID=A0AAD6J396_DREDA|nr:hypothetical protein Dda_2299 [Drechslerella dactyloides]